MQRPLSKLLSGLVVLLLAACASGAPPLPTATVGAAPPETAPPSVTAPPATATAAPTPTAAPTEPALPEASPTAEPTDASGLPVASGDPLLRAYRSLVAIQVNAALVAEAVRQVQAGRVDEDERPVAALAIGALTQAVDEGLAGTTPPPELAAPWQTAVARHDEVKALGAQWLIGLADVDDVSAALVPIQADLRQALAQADVVLAATYGVEVAELTSHRERLVAAIGRVFE